MSSPHVDRRTLTGRIKRLELPNAWSSSNDTKEQSHKILTSRGESVIGGLASLFAKKRIYGGVCSFLLFLLVFKR
jgi:hypothetical protein